MKKSENELSVGRKRPKNWRLRIYRRADRSGRQYRHAPGHSQGTERKRTDTSISRYARDEVGRLRVDRPLSQKRALAPEAETYRIATPANNLRRRP